MNLSSIRRLRVDRMLSHFFNRELLPIAKTMRLNKESLLLMDRDEAVGSYFVSVQKSDRLMEGMVEGGISSEENIDRGLSNVFSMRGRLDLLATIRTTAILAKRLRRVREIEKKVSGFIYEMY